MIDEAHRASNATSQTHKVLKALRIKARILLTGTPYNNDMVRNVE